MPPLLSSADRTAFAGRLARYVKHENLKRCVVIFHGGEPLLAGADLIVGFANELRAAVGPEAVIDVGLQTNGLLLTKGVLKAFETENIAVSLSLDGPKETNDRHRKTRKGRSSFAKTSAALNLLKGHPAIFSGIIAVIDPHVEPETLFEFFNSHQPPKLDFLLPDAHHSRPPPGRDLQHSLYRDWLIRAFDLWFGSYPHLRVRTFEAILDAVAGLPSGTDAFGLGDVSLITVETDGSYHDLDVLKVVGQGATRLEGSVRDTDIVDLANSAAIASHRRLLRKEGLSAACRECPEVEICGGGSLPHRYGPGGFNHPTVYCAEMLALISHVRGRLQEGLSENGADKSAKFSMDFSFGEFELAEDATDPIKQLLDRAAAAQQAQFFETLNVIAAGQPDLAPTVEVIRSLPPTEITRIATSPGSIAWQRALANRAAGRAVYAVDGSVIIPDYSYLGFLVNPENRMSANVSVGSEDPWLRAPFGSAIYFETEEVAKQARPVVAQALEIVERWRPALASEIRKACRAIQFVRDPTAHPDKIVSFSDNVVPGALFVSVIQGGRLIDPYDLADSLVHEHRHQKLYLLERECELIEPNSIKVVSPWREDLRPPSGLLHAIFVFVELRRFWEHVRDSGPPRLRTRAVNQLFETDLHLEQGFETLESCPLTSAGRKLASVLADAQERRRAVA
jgi:uncharacterized protein